MNTPFLDKIEELRTHSGRFHVPGHKGNPKAIPFAGEFLAYDLTEIEGADNLQSPTETLLQSEENMAAAYGAGATLYSANGSTSCIEAMLALYLSEGETAVMDRNCHISAVRALGFLGAEPIWVFSQEGEAVSVSAVEQALQNSSAKVVYVTSPTYNGALCDLSSLADLCKKYGASLLVDNAHGAHLILFGLHPMQLSADASAESAHKTLPALTPAAMLHLKDKHKKASARGALNLFCSTSPSYPVLCSLDYCAGLLLEGLLDYTKPAAEFALLRKVGGAMVVSYPRQDPCKLTLCPARAGYALQQVAAALCKAGIEPEMVHDPYIVLMTTSFNSEQDFSNLLFVLRQFLPKEPISLPEFKIRPPLRGCSVRQALFAKKERIATEQALNRIAADVYAPCPPGISVVMPGEVLSENVLKTLLKCGIFETEVVL